MPPPAGRPRLWGLLTSLKIWLRKLMFQRFFSPRFTRDWARRSRRFNISRKPLRNGPTTSFSSEENRCPTPSALIPGSTPCFGVWAFRISADKRRFPPLGGKTGRRPRAQRVPSGRQQGPRDYPGYSFSDLRADDSGPDGRTPKLTARPKQIAHRENRGDL